MRDRRGDGSVDGSGGGADGGSEKSGCITAHSDCVLCAPGEAQESSGGFVRSPSRGCWPSIALIVSTRDSALTMSARPSMQRTMPERPLAVGAI